MYPGFDDCLQCAVAYMVQQSPSDITSIRRINAGDAWLVDFNREVARQQGALMPCGEQLLPKCAGGTLVFSPAASEPLLSSYLFELGVMAVVLGTLLTWLGMALFKAWRARRADRQLQDALRLRYALGLHEPYVVRNPTIRLTRRGQEVLCEMRHIPEDTQ
jgi:hypothetical protein